MPRQLVLATLLALGVAPNLSAQRPHATQAQLRTEIRAVLMGLREAAARHDWPSMSWAFPKAGPITETVRAVVTQAPDAGGLSFWTPSAKVDFDALVVAPVKEDLVAFTLPFLDGTSPGSYGAVFERKNGGWQLTCFQEAFPRTAMAPGCVPSGPHSL